MKDFIQATILGALTINAVHVNAETVDACAIYGEGWSRGQPFNDGSARFSTGVTFDGALQVSTVIYYELLYSGQVVSSCWVAENNYFRNDPGKEALGELDTPEEFIRYRNGIRRRESRSFEDHFEPAEPVYRPGPPGAVGPRGSLEMIGGDLLEASPAWRVSLENTNDPYVRLPFIVKEAGDGDALSIFNNETLVWNQPLAAFTEGDLNFARFVAPDTAYDTYVFTVWLQSTGDANARVFVATEWEFTPVPIPAACWLFVSGLGCLRWGRQITRRDSECRAAISDTHLFCRPVTRT